MAWIMPRPTVSGCTYGTNCESLVAECLKSLSWADEVVYVDGGSSDRSIEVARAAGAKVFQKPWEGFRQRLEALEQFTTGDWIFALDADERASPALADEIRRRTSAPPGPDAYAVARRTLYMGRWLAHGEWFPDRTTRLWRRGAARFVGGVHAKVTVAGPVGRLSVPIEHFGETDLSEQMRKIERYSSQEARELFAAGVDGAGWKAVTRPPARFLKGYLLKGGVLDGWQGFLAAAMTSYHVFAKYAKLRALRSTEGKP